VSGTHCSTRFGFVLEGSALQATEPAAGFATPSPASLSYR
jgi:hypothetical protein